MDTLRTQIFVFLVILSLTLTVYVHGKEEIESDRDLIITDYLNAENSKSSESKSRVARQYEDVENGRQLARDLRIEREARRNLEVQVKQMQEKLNSVIDFKDKIEDASQNYRNLSSSVTSIIVIRGLRGLTNNVSELTTKVSFLDNNLMRVQNEMKDSINASYVSQLTKTLQDTKNLEKSGYQTIKLEISPNVREMKDKADVCESVHSQQYVPCKEGWFLYSEKCYKIFSEHKKWSEASQKCAVEGGHLATVSSNELQEFFNIFFLLDVRSAAWIGLTDREMESNFTWEDGSRYSYTYWDHDQPDGRSAEDCIEMRFGVHPRSNPRELGYWNDLGCDATLPYVCQVDKNKGVKKFSPDPRFCSINEGGGFKHLEFCYHIVRAKKSWEEAEKHCEENYSGHLVTILDTEAEMFLNYILSNINDDFWIGIRRHDKASQKWVSGWPVAHNRLYRDLKEYPKGTCVLRSKNNLWTTAECSREYPFICERAKIQAPVLKKAPEGWQCPDISNEWIDLGGESCYIFGANKELNWYQANYECGRKGGTLASITSREEAISLEHFVTDDREVFIGLHRSLSNNQRWEWVDGSRMEYTYWEPGEPNNEREHCGEFFSKYLALFKTWRDIDCYGTRGRLYICSAKKVPPSASTARDCICTKETPITEGVPGRLRCPDLSNEWQDVEGEYCYIFVTNKSRRWDEAHYECGRKGGILASIHSEEQANILREYMKNSERYVYIGLHRSIEKKDIFEWADGSKVDYVNWRPTEPSDRKEECVEIFTENMKWNDINCDSSKGYICAAKKVSSSLINKTTFTSGNCACP